MPEEKTKKESTITMSCPECGTDVSINLSDGTGDCPKCGLDCYAVRERVRYNRAVRKLESESEPEPTPPKKRRRFGPFGE